MRLFILLLFFISLFANNNEWQEVSQKNNILIYEKNEDKFEFSQFKGEVLLPYSVKQISRVILRPLSYPNWLADCIHAKRLFTATLKVHLITQPPWPLKPRQVNVIIKKKKRAGATIITINSIKLKSCILDYDAVWFNFLHAEFTLVPIGENQTVVRLELAADPGGKIPLFLVNATGWMIPYQSLRDLRNYLQEHHNKGKE